MPPAVPWPWGLVLNVPARAATAVTDARPTTSFIVGLKELAAIMNPLLLLPLLYGTSLKGN